MTSKFLATNLIILFAFFFRSFSGFGGALLSIPLLAILFPLKFIIPVESLLEVGLSAMLLPSVIRRADRSSIPLLVGGSFIGCTVGVYFLNALANDQLKVPLGIVIIVLALSLLRNKATILTGLKGLGLPVGIFGGVLGGLFGTSGPAYIAYLSSRGLKKEVFRSTLIVIFTFENLWRLSLYVWDGLLTRNELEFAISLTPILILATYLGHLSQLQINEKTFRRIIVILLLFSGIFQIF